MTHASSNETLGNYFNELLSEPSAKKDTQSTSHVETDEALAATPAEVPVEAKKFEPKINKSTLIDEKKRKIVDRSEKILAPPEQAPLKKSPSEPASQEQAPTARQVTPLNESEVGQTAQARKLPTEQPAAKPPLSPNISNQHKLISQSRSEGDLSAQVLAGEHRQRAQRNTHEQIPRVEPAGKITQAMPAEQSKPLCDERDVQLEQEQKTKLQALLNEQALVIPDELIAVEEDVLDTQLAQTELAVDIASDIATEVITSTTLDTDTALDIDTGAQVETDTYIDVQWADNGRPQWAQARFEALLFDVAGLTLAVPLVALGQIVTLDENLTPIFGQSDWFMGIFPTPHGKFRVVNTALFVMPEKYQSRYIDKAEYAISLDGVPWALAVDSINQPVSLDPTEIKWRTERSKRPWLAGTVKSAMCALLDIPQMAKMLVEQDHGGEG